MNYYLSLYSPETYEAFDRSDRTISGFRISQLNVARKLHLGDRLLCYMTKLSRWVGILEVTSEVFQDDTPLFLEDSDPFTVRFLVKPLVWLAKDKAIPVHEDHVWNQLSFTSGHAKNSSTWTGKLRSSLSQIDAKDAVFLEKLLLDQDKNGTTYAVDEAKFRKLVKQRVKRADKSVAVTIPEKDETEEVSTQATQRDSIKIQALLSRIGEAMGFRIWLPRNDRSRVQQAWQPEEQSLLESLPLNYDQTTLKTIENIDVLWLRGRSIVRTFEVEHTTAVYSGLLRMADLLALQPNMDIKLHIVAPDERRGKVFEEIQRPVFSLLEKGPLSELCTFLSYQSVTELSTLKHLSHVTDSILEEYVEVPE